MSRKIFLGIVNEAVVISIQEYKRVFEKEESLVSFFKRSPLYGVERFQGRLISIDAKIADKWGYLQADRSLPVIDSLMAACALVHNYKLITRNAKDFKGIIGLEVINPWEGTPRT